VSTSSSTQRKGFTPYDLKPWFTRRLSTFIGWADRKRISPDVFTGVGVIGAVIGALVLALPGFDGPKLSGVTSLILVFIFGLVVRLGGANLDGAVARARGVSRPAGFILNELGDRISDFILFFGLYLGTPEALRPGVVAVAMLASLPTLISVSGAAVGAPRLNGGPFGKTERSLVFALAAGVLPYGLNDWQLPAYGALIAVTFIGSVLTSLKRFRRINGHLATEGTKWVDDQPTVVKGSGSK
jgi:CDP-diacylglycerol--glycerol-3-phosphate 3-phosphatidyltransferase